MCCMAGPCWLNLCPDCKQGTVYEVAQPGVLVRIVGQAPLQARVYELQKLRCNLCGKVFSRRTGHGAMMRIAFSPCLTMRPSRFHWLKPATKVASGLAIPINRQLPQLYL